MVYYNLAGLFVIYVYYGRSMVQASEEYVTRESKQGWLLGTRKTARDGAEFHAFLGIPYAQPPLNELRWEAPKPAANWKGIRNATRHPSLCVQEYVMNPNEVIGNSFFLIPLMVETITFVFFVIKYRL